MVSAGNGILLRKDVRTQATTRTTQEDIALRQTSHLQRDPRYVIRSVTCTEAESGMVAARGWGEGGMGSYCLVGADFQFCKNEAFWRWMGAVVAQQGECSNATELYA